MSDTPQGPGWWQASDGRWYPPEQFTGAANPQPGPSGAPHDPTAVWTPDAVYQQPSGQAPAGQPHGQPYGQVGYGYGAMPPKNDTQAVTALVLGILAFPLMCICGIFSIPCSVGAIVLGIVSRRKIAASNGQFTGDGLALAGLILGSIAAALSIVGIFAWGALIFAGGSTS